MTNKSNHDYDDPFGKAANPDFSMKKFLTSPDTIGVLVVWAFSFVFLFIASTDWIKSSTVKVILSFLGISITFTITDRLIELYNEKKYGIKPQKKTLFGPTMTGDKNEDDD